MRPNRKLNRKSLPQHTLSHIWWGKTDAPCVCVRARTGADALITIIPNIHRSPPTCRINIRNLLYVQCAASASAPTTASAPGWIRACLICNEGSQGWAEGSESRENIYPLTAIPPCFPINQFLCPLVLVLLHTGACSGLMWVEWCIFWAVRVIPLILSDWRHWKAGFSSSTYTLSAFLPWQPKSLWRAAYL